MIAAAKVLLVIFCGWGCKLASQARHEIGYWTPLEMMFDAAGLACGLVAAFL